MNQKSRCEDCMNYVYDDEMACFICLVDLDQDDMENFLTYATQRCPYYRFLDDYVLAGKQ